MSERQSVTGQITSCLSNKMLPLQLNYNNIIVANHGVVNVCSVVIMLVDYFLFQPTINAKHVAEMNSL